MKRDFGMWATRREDVTAALDSWVAFWKANNATPRDILGARRAFVAFIADYGRIFTGDFGVPSKMPFVPASDAALHEQLMNLRNQAVAHSGLEYRDVRLYPPGALCEGLAPVPAHELDAWRWLVRAGELHVDAEHVEQRLRSLQKDFQERALRKFDDLMKHCSDRIVAVTETPLDSF